MWSSPPSALILVQQEAHIWKVNLNVRPKHKIYFWGTLSLEEQNRAERFRFEKDKEHFIISRGVLRRLLGRYLQIDAREIKFQYGTHGKPMISKNHALQFNISHSEGFALLGFVSHLSIGVDIQVMNPGIDIFQIAKRVFSPNEFKALDTMHSSEQVLAFFNGWSRKEAFIKAKGEGLSFALDTFDVSIKPNDPPKVLSTSWNIREASNWSLYKIDVNDGFVGAMALEGHVDTVRYFDFLTCCMDNKG